MTEKGCVIASKKVFVWHLAYGFSSVKNLVTELEEEVAISPSLEDLPSIILQHINFSCRFVSVM